MAPVHVTSEIGPLRAVLVHTPGRELVAVTPGNREDYLYDDIIDLDLAQQEHAQLVAVLQRFAEVYEVRDLLTELVARPDVRSEEHTSELQSQSNIVCRLLLEKKNAAALAAFKSGSVDVMDVQPAQASAAASAAQLARELIKTPAFTVYWLTFRITSPRLGNARVRQAISQAIDRKAFFFF